MADDRSSRTERPELGAERGVAQYHRLASLLRHRIAKGDYPLGMHAAANPSCRVRAISYRLATFSADTHISRLTSHA